MTAATASDADDVTMRDHTEDGRLVYVYGLTERVAQRHLDEIFGHYGHIERIEMPRPGSCHRVLC